MVLDGEFDRDVDMLKLSLPYPSQFLATENGLRRPDFPREPGGNLLVSREPQSLQPDEPLGVMLVVGVGFAGVFEGRQRL